MTNIRNCKSCDWEGADEWTNLNNRLRLVTARKAVFAAAQGEVVRIAAAARQTLGATAGLYQCIAMNQGGAEGFQR